jgi:L-fuculose-phosphate aldolase
MLPVPYSDAEPPLSRSGGWRDETSLRGAICTIGRLLHTARLINGMAGSISARLDEHRILITPTNVSKGFLQPDQLIIHRFTEPTPELALHAAVYTQRPDAHGIILAAPPTAIALTIAGVSMRTCVVPETVITLGLIPTAAYTMPYSPAQHDAVRILIAQHDAILLAHHGALTVGADVWQAFMKMEMVEHTAEILHRAAQVGKIAPLPPAEVARLLELRRASGYARPGDDERFCDMCGVC